MGHFIHGSRSPTSDLQHSRLATARFKLLFPGCQEVVQTSLSSIGRTKVLILKNDPKNGQARLCPSPQTLRYENHTYKDHYTSTKPLKSLNSSCIRLSIYLGSPRKGQRITGGLGKQSQEGTALNRGVRNMRESVALDLM